MMPILGKPMLLHQIERINRSSAITTLVVVTSTSYTDDIIADLCAANNIACFRGDLNNVLDRFYQASIVYKPSVIVRLTGDNPLADHRVIDAVINAHYSAQVDYASNVHPPTYPDGLDVEVFKTACLHKAWQQAVLPSEKEHVTPFIHTRPDTFSMKNVCYGEDVSHLRWTVDEQADFDFVSRVYEHLYQTNQDFSMQDIMMLIKENTHLQAINAAYQRNEGYLKSLRHDEFFINTGGKNHV